MKGKVNYVGITTEFTRSSLEFYRNYNLNGKPSTQILFGGFDFTIPTDENGLRFLEELLKIDRKFYDNNQPDSTPNEIFKPFTVTVYDEQGYTTRNIELIDAHIKNYREVFAAFQDYQGSTNTSMSIDIKVVSAIQRINKKALNVFRWHYSDYGLEEYQSPVNAVEENKNPQVIKGYWTSDKEGKEALQKSKLGETVYFQIETKDIDNGEKLELRLGEYDYSFWFDNLDPDDYEFPVEEIKKTVIIKDNKATVELLLEETWDKLVKDDHDEWFQSNKSIELYWEVKYKNQKKQLPQETNDYLRVAQSDKTLYIKTPTPNHNLPEFISNDGNPMLLMKFAKKFVKGKVKKEILKTASEEANKVINQIAFTKLKKGYLVDNNGKVYTGKRLIYEYKKMYSNSGELFENVQKGKNFTYTYQGTTHTTKGISQYDYFSKSGKRVTFLGMVKNVGKVLDLFSLFDKASNDLDMSKPIPLDFGPLSPIFGLAGVLIQEQKAESDMFLLEDMQLEVDEAKLKGLEATRAAINSWHHELNTWEILPVSNETANKLLQGEFKTFEELENFENDIDFPSSSTINILYRIVENKNRDEEIFIIETIFIDE